MEKPKLLCDENFDPAVTLGLRRAGFDVTHIYEVDRSGYSDEQQLLFAIQEGCVFLTQDRKDFVVLHHEYLHNGWEHCGIVICTPYDTRAMIRELINFFEDKPETMSNGIWYV